MSNRGINFPARRPCGIEWTPAELDRLLARRLELRAMPPEHLYKLRQQGHVTTTLAEHGWVQIMPGTFVLGLIGPFTREEAWEYFKGQDKSWRSYEFLTITAEQSRQAELRYRKWLDDPSKNVTVGPFDPDEQDPLKVMREHHSDRVAKFRAKYGT